MDDVNRIFSNSEFLDQYAIEYFITSLCKYSELELSDPVNPRTFCLQQLVLVTANNMERVRAVWKTIWHAISSHFVKVGSH